MADQAPRAPQQYKRSWKNLLINKKYQLRFTLFMVGIATLLMAGLGFRVMIKANEATTVSKTHVLGEVCPPISVLTEGEGSAAVDDAPPPPTMKLDDDAGSAAPAADPKADAKDTPKADAKDAPKADAKDAPKADAKDAPKGKADPKAKGDKDDAEPRHVQVQIDESSLTLTPTVPIWTPPISSTSSFVDQIASHWKCQLAIGHKLEALDFGRLRILLVLIASGLLLVFGLAVYGIKMTHKVAGPLFKVGLYFGKMREGRLDKVYNLRKGDQLVDFYEHFKTAHAGAVQLQQDDIARLKAVITAAEASGQGEHATIVELRAMLERKEKSLE
jgi:hypothetical protein